MTSERMMQMAELVLRVSEIQDIMASITIGDSTVREVFLHDLRDSNEKKWSCTVYCADGRKSEQTRGVTFIEDINFDAAEAHLRAILEGVEEW